MSLEAIELERCRWPGCDFRPTVGVYEGEAYCRHHALEVADREARIWAMERWRRLCRRCDAPAHDVHHVVTRQARYIRHDRRNLMPLCRPCHTWAHSDRSAFDVWVDTVAPELHLELWSAEAKGENRGGHVDLAAVIRGFREEQLSEEEYRRYRSGAWLH